MTLNTDAVADCVLSTFEGLPDKRKPRVRTEAREWVPLAGVVLAKDGKLSCVSLGTGMKCLPSSKIPLSNGAVLHDWHAEILAIRAFNRFLLDQALLLLTSPHQPSPFLHHRSQDECTADQPQPFTIKEDVQIFMYCSEAPCGDASMELIMDAQEDDTPWTGPVSTVPYTTSPPMDPLSNNVETLEPIPSTLRGRSHFSHLSHLRYKPSRPDASPTLSKSCSDKLAHTQCTSLLSSFPSLLISPSNAYITALILPASQLVPAACERAFSATGRMANVAQLEGSGWSGGYQWSAFEVAGTTREFTWGRRGVACGRSEKFVSSNLSAAWTPAWQETLIGGVLQGRKQFDLRGASRVCRRSLWKLAFEIAAVMGWPASLKALRGLSYAQAKRSEALRARRTVKDDVRRLALRGWARNAGDEDFSL